MRTRMWAVAALAAAPMLIAGCHSGSSAASAPSKAPAKAPSKSASKSASKSPSKAAAAPGAATAQEAVLKTKKTKIGTVLTNAAGDTLYWYGKDTTAKSACTGSCASLWPALEGKPQAAPGTMLSGLGTIKAPSGTQITFKGHPLYTYKSDTAPGETKGTSVAGWHAATTSTPVMK
jgi:predicted lipoprotein with Yx(FWY)xxD motif